MAQMIKNPPAMQETWVLCLGWEGPPGGEHDNSIFLPGESPLTEGPGGPWWSMGLQRVRHD